MDHAEPQTVTGRRNGWIAAAAFLLIAGLPLTAAGTATGKPAGPDSAGASLRTAAAAGTASGRVLRNGRYEAESPDWTGMRVAVRIEGGRLSGVEVLKAKGTPRYYERVVRRLPACMERTGSAEVDGVTGATLSSNSLKEAVRAALKKAESENTAVR
jgi:uncharacterized protein with FMN-binding domain